MSKKKENPMIATPHSLGYDDYDDESDIDDDISEDEYKMEKLNNAKPNQPSLTQILMVCRLLGKREFILSKNGTRKFYKKVRQYQELSQHEKNDDVNYGSRMGKCAEILCKFAAIVEMVKISMEILK